MTDQLVDSWMINHRINLYLLDAIPPDALSAVPVGMKGRSVAEIFAHLHKVRGMWLEPAAPDLAVGLPKLPTKTKADKDALTKDVLRAALTQSGERMGQLFLRGVEQGKLPNIKPHVAGFLGYLIAHEGYHRGEIGMTLTLAGHPLPDEIAYGLWDWEKR
ncbi:MAG: DinB family protein [Anaerolineae bacterium]|nr:DinB family protein [Anaerolineae bacterium]